MKKFLIGLLILGFGMASAQEEPQSGEKDPFLPKGNKAYADKKFNEAEADYRRSQSKFPKKSDASYNLGNSIYKLRQPAEAKSAYLNAIKNAGTRPEKHRAYHNLGNVFMGQKDYQSAVSAYKNALVNDPSDEESRYNYALAKKMLKDNPPPKNKDDKKDDKKDKDKDKDKQQDKQKDQNKDQDKDKDQKKDDKGRNDPDKQQGNQPDQQPKPRPGGISQQRMQNMLDAVNNEEKKVQDKVKAQQQKGRPVQTDKDW